jgi:heme/copper-type cytochrome/quinol oxidase subunit 2
MARLGYKRAVSFAAVAALAVGSFLLSSSVRASQGREVSVTGNDFTFSPSRIEVQQNDLVKVTFTATDMAHSFTIDSYRIAKRAGAGQSVTFEFRADQPGEHVFLCNLTHDDRCRNMKGTLVVR